MDLGKGSNKSSANSPAVIGLIAVITVLLGVGGLVIAQLTPVLFPDQASAEANQIDQLFKVMLGIGGSIFLLVQGVLIYSIIRYRKRQGDNTDGPTVHGNVTLEVVWTAIPAVVVLGLVIYSYQVWVDIQEPKEDELVVHVEARRFGWTFLYEDERLTAGNGNGNENSNATRFPAPDLHVYAGQPVRLVMETEDVIHSFWVPEMRIKQDLLPGRTTEMRITPQLVDGRASDEYPLRYRVVCTELCGSGHGAMFTYVYLHEDEESYMQWVDSSVESVLNPPEDPVLNGMRIMASGVYGCQSCHALQDSREGMTLSWDAVTGPSLQGIADRASTRVSGQPAEEYLYESIYDPGAYIVPGYGNIMNQYQFVNPDAAHYLPKPDAEAITAYLCTVSDEFTPEELAENPLCDFDNLLSYSEMYTMDGMN
ncbi:MAG: cytochrome c oxidase subunit II [Anaerolineaceae bacterium]|nr:MAG: cytochrome c oxidase subunit II [Anaerolineaceae bacterium]